MSPVPVRRLVGDRMVLWAGVDVESSHRQLIVCRRGFLPGRQDGTFLSRSPSRLAPEREPTEDPPPPAAPDASDPSADDLLALLTICARAARLAEHHIAALSLGLGCCTWPRAQAGNQTQPHQLSSLTVPCATSTPAHTKPFYSEQHCQINAESADSHRCNFTHSDGY